MIIALFAITAFANSADNGVYKFVDVKGDDATVGKAVDFTFDMDGKKVKFSEFTKGKVVFLNFWGTWCPPCRKEIPDIIEIQKELKNKDFVVIGIASERATVDQAIEKVKKYANKNNINYINLVMDAKKQLLKRAYEKATENPLQYVPTTIIIDKKGDIHHVIVGGRDKAGFMNAINQVIN
jgi:thiol-disulfide isomerase/thioredoxin